MIKLSILIPSIPERFDRAKELTARMEAQIGGREDVELIVLMDNKVLTIGEKRNAIKSLANGKYFSMIDDDDDVSDNYVEKLMEAIDQYDVDVITFDSRVYIEDKTGVVSMSINHENEQWTPDEITRRQPFHMCAWKTHKFKSVNFPSLMYGEDAEFSNRAMGLVESEHHIDEILHLYYWDREVTQAFDRESKIQTT